MTANGGNPSGDRQALEDDVRELRAMLAAAVERLDLLTAARRRQLAASRSGPSGRS